MRWFSLSLWLLCAACSGPVAQRSAGTPDASEGRLQAIQEQLFAGLRREPYLLDSVARYLDPSEPLACDADSMVVYKSDLGYSVRVHPAFAERLERFDALVKELATAHYGRAPRKLLHRGAYVCRSTRGRRARLSEHALGNALDVAGLEFGPVPRRVPTPEGMPPAARRRFAVRVLSHWSPRRPADAYHAQFLHRLADALRARPDIFRGIVGPPHRRHHDHLHLDAAPWRYARFGYEPVGGAPAM